MNNSKLRMKISTKVLLNESFSKILKIMNEWMNDKFYYQEESILFWFDSSSFVLFYFILFHNLIYSYLKLNFTLNFKKFIKNLSIFNQSNK